MKKEADLEGGQGIFDNQPKDRQLSIDGNAKINFYRTTMSSVSCAEMGDYLRKLCSPDAWKSHLRASRIQNFSWGVTPDPPGATHHQHWLNWPSANLPLKGEGELI